MATNIIYKGELNGTQVDFSTGSLTDISTFDTDVRSSAIQNQIVDGVTDRGASQDAIYAMSGYLAANAHPDVTPASNVSIDNSSGVVLQDATFTFDADGHVTAASFVSADLDDRYYTELEVQSISGVLNTKISTNASDITTLEGATGSLNTRLSSAEDDIDNLQTSSGSLNTRLTSAEGDIDNLQTATGSLNTRLGTAEGDIGTLETATGNLNTRLGTAEGDIDDLETASGNLNSRLGTAESEIDALQAASDNYLSLTLDNVCDNNATTDQDIQVNNIRVDGGSITGPATIIIDPDAVGASGTVVIQGDLDVRGTTTTINSTEVQVGDINLVLGTGATEANMDGGGIILSGTEGVAASWTYDSSTNRWDSNVPIEANLTGTASAADTWTSNATITLGGDLSGNVTFNAGSSATLNATIQPLSVEGSMLANDAVSGIKIADNSIDSEHYVDYSVDNVHLANSSITITASNGLSGGGTPSLGGTTSLSTSSDQSHLDEIELGSDNSAETNVVTKGGILILRGTDNNGITTSGADGNAINLNDKTTVAFEGVVQSADTAQDNDNGSYVAMWKIQGVIRRDADSTNMLQSFVTKTFAGANASSYGIDISVSSNGLKISSDQTTATLITSATINYNWIEETV